MTDREKEIIALIVDGMSNKQIASRLNISVFTIKNHIHNIVTLNCTPKTGPLAKVEKMRYATLS